MSSIRLTRCGGWSVTSVVLLAVLIIAQANSFAVQEHVVAASSDPVIDLPFAVSLTPVATDLRLAGQRLRVARIQVEQSLERIVAALSDPHRPGASLRPLVQQHSGATHICWWQNDSLVTLKLRESAGAESPRVAAGLLIISTPARSQFPIAPLLPAGARLTRHLSSTEAGVDHWVVQARLGVPPAQAAEQLVRHFTQLGFERSRLPVLAARPGVRVESRTGSSTAVRESQPALSSGAGAAQLLGFERHRVQVLIAVHPRVEHSELVIHASVETNAAASNLSHRRDL